jgi:methionyl-tRNA synthetase
MTNKFYITTPIYYPTADPHMGTAYSTIAADVLARWNSIIGKDVFFLTGTDDHGKKVLEYAKKENLSPKEFTDKTVKKFKEDWKKLNISYDRFIRTTDNDHKKVVEEILNRVYKNGDIYKGTYEGWYCTECEAYYTEKDLVDGKCPIHKKTVDKLKEESYFFKLSKYQKFLLKLYKDNPEFISPKQRKNEIIKRVKEDLRDFSISRSTFDWGVKLPFDKKHIAYVWFDALINYYSATRSKGKEKFWPADIHVVGKDIIWFHAVYWPAMLKSAGIELPKVIFAHGFWTVLNEKIGKSAGNAISVNQLIDYAGVDSARYFLIREAPFGRDGDFSEKVLIERHNNELANKLGNLVSRVSSLAEKYGTIKTENKLLKKLPVKSIEKNFEEYHIDRALSDVFSFIDICNEYIQAKKPWETKDKKVLYELAESIKETAKYLKPFIPQTSEKIKKQFSNLNKIKKGEILFKKI